MANLLLPISPNQSTDQQLAMINRNFAELDTQQVTKIFRDENGTRRILLGKGKDGFYGVRVSQTGKDVYDGAADEMVMSSDDNLFKIVSTGTATVVKAALDNAENVVIPHGLGYAPLVIAFGTQESTTTSIPVPEVVPDISTGLIAKQTSLYVDDTNIVLSVIAPSWVGNTFYTDPLTYTFRYYIIRETAAVS